MLTRKTLLLAKKETTYGVDPSPSVSDDAIEVFDFSITPNIDTVDRNLYRPSLSPVASIPSKKYTEVSFSVELKGGGVDAEGKALAPKYVRLLEACGMSVEVQEDDTSRTTILKPTSTDIPSVAMYAYLDGVLYKVLGARGNMTLRLEANQIGRIEFTFNGLFVTPTDTTFPTVSCDTGLIPPIVKNVNLTMGGYAPILSAFEVTLDNDLVQRDDMNAVEGVGEIVINGRNTNGSVNPDMMKASEYDIWTAFQNGTETQISAVVGSATGNTIEVVIPKAVYSSVGIGDRDGVRIYDVRFTCVGCDDELEIRFK